MQPANYIHYHHPVDVIDLDAILDLDMYLHAFRTVDGFATEVFCAIYCRYPESAYSAWMFCTSIGFVATQLPGHY